ncbi:MAG: hypothetical protein M3Q65_01855 [Chloroflexota bacterium]|nr:hypothetical protein [Chloroflexota bacterium]
MGAEPLSRVELEGTLAAIRRRVRARHGLPPDGPDDLGSEPEGGRGALGEAMDAAHISAHLPIGWDVPIVGRGLALTKRAVRLLLRWYINPIVDQQNDFNAAAVRALYELAAEQERLRLMIADCGSRIAELERRHDESGARNVALGVRNAEQGVGNAQ